LVASLAEGKIARSEIKPEQAGLGRARLTDLKGGSAADNAVRLTGLLAGETGPYRDIVLLNAAAALMVAGAARDIMAGMELAGRALDSGGAQAKLGALVTASNR